MKFFKFIMFIYILATGIYFINKLLPKAELLFKNIQKEEVEQTIENNCLSFSIGHITTEKEVRVLTRFFRNIEKINIDENNLVESISSQSCDRLGQKAIVFKNSKPAAIAHVETYDYTTPIGKDSKEQNIVYTNLKIDSYYTEINQGDYIVVVFTEEPNKLTGKNYDTLPITKEDEEVIVGNADTIFYEILNKESYDLMLEYSALKTDVNNDSYNDLIAIAKWHKKDLRHTTIFILSFNKNNLVTRHMVFPLTQLRNSYLFIEQVVDLDDDGYKEIVVRKNRKGKDAFTVYKYDSISDMYLERFLF